MEFSYDKNRIFYEQDGTLLAEVTFPAEADGVVNLNHTFVDDSLRGQGVAGKLMEAAAAYFRKNKLKVRPTCSYAIKWFEKNTDNRDLLA